MNPLPDCIVHKKEKQWHTFAGADEAFRHKVQDPVDKHIFNMMCSCGPTYMYDPVGIYVRHFPLT